MAWNRDNFTLLTLFTAEALVPDPSHFEVEIAIAKLKRHKSPDSDEILAELIQGGGKHYVPRSINELLPFGMRKNCLWKESIIVPVHITKDVSAPPRTCARIEARDVVVKPEYPVSSCRLNENDRSHIMKSFSLPDDSFSLVSAELSDK
jgi:hypothetical protein